MTLKGDAKFEEKLICGLKNDMMNMANFHQSNLISQNWDEGILLSKIVKVWAQTPQRSYVSWKWRMMQNLQRNWLVISKLAWGIWWILNRALESLKNFHVNVLLLSKVYIASAKKVQRSYLPWNWRGIQNLERNQLVF